MDNERDTGFEPMPLYKYADLPPAPKKKEKPEEKVERGVSEVDFTVDCTVDHNVL